MVQIISPSPRAMQQGQIGQALGIGLSKRMGLQEAENAANTAQGDPVKLAFALARASAAAPGMERSLGQIYEQLLSRTNVEGVAKGLNTNQQNFNNENSENLPPGSISPESDIAPSMDTPSNTPFTPENKLSTDTTIYPDKSHYNKEDVNLIASQYVMDNRPDLVAGSTSYGRIPTFNFNAQSDLRPEEEGQIRQNLLDRKIPPKSIDQIIETTRNDIKNRYNEKIKSMEFDATRQKEINEKWNQFSNAADENLLPLTGKYSSTFGFGGKPKTSNDLKNKYLQYASELPVNLTPQQMHAQAGTMLQKDITRIDQLSALPELPFIRDPSQIEENIKDRKEAYRELVKEGYLETVKEDAVLEGNMGLEELHSTIWGDQTDKKSLNNIGSIKAPQLYLENKNYSPFQSTKGEETLSLMLGKPKKTNPNYEKERKMYVENLSNRLMNIKPEDDLILLRAQALNQNANERDFNDALELAQEKGYKLSPFQQNQLQEVRIPRQPPIWQLFNPPAWGKWINNLAGKR